MSENVAFDEQAIIKRALEAMRSNGPTVPRDSVKRFLALIGEEIKRVGEIRQEVIGRLLERLHPGAI